MHPEHRSIGELAYHLWQARGCPEGSAEQDWLDAERQLRSARRVAETHTAQPPPGRGAANRGKASRAPRHPADK
jgi:hypothetical protein